MNLRSIYFAVPGDINTLTGGYGYDRRLLQELRQLALNVQMHSLHASFPFATPDALATAASWLASLPDGSVVMIDGLAFGVMDSILAPHASRLKLVALCHHPLALENGLNEAQQRKFQVSEQKALAFASAIIVTSDRTGKTLCERFAVPANRITVAMPGTEQQGFAPANQQPPVLLTVATLTQRKAHHVLIAALSRLAHLPWQARFIGGDHFDPAWALQLHTQVEAAKLGARITFVGEKSQLHEDYMAASLFVLPSLYEGYGMVFAEALSYGLPIIAARAGAVPELVPPSAGVLVEPGSVDALASALERVLTSRELHAQLQQGARAAAPTLPRWQDTATTVKAVLLDS